MKKHIFIIGSKGIPANYGGFETFADQLVKRKKDSSIQYHVACMGREKKEFTYRGADCFQLKIPDIGAARALYYDVQALRYCLRYIRKNHIQNADLYILACRIGPFMGHYKKQIQKLGMKLYINPDGHEWLRGKWNGAIKKYWKFSEKLMVKHASLLICDSKNIEAYIKREYAAYNPSTTFIAYGAEIAPKQLKQTDRKGIEWYQKHHLRPKEYYLVVGRFVPENNYKVMIQEFMKSKTTKSLVFITNLEENKFYHRLLEETKFDTDERIQFAGTIYDSELITRVRSDAFAYIHGHEVGGTNPSLLEALGTTRLNLLLEVGFNQEVGGQGALYWSKEEGSLAALIEKCDAMPDTLISEIEKRAKQRIRDEYSWEKIVAAYEALFLDRSQS